jgi:hypothetical protein
VGGLVVGAICCFFVLSFVGKVMELVKNPPQPEPPRIPKYITYGRDKSGQTWVLNDDRHPMRTRSIDYKNMVHTWIEELPDDGDHP